MRDIGDVFCKARYMHLEGWTLTHIGVALGLNEHEVALIVGLTPALPSTGGSDAAA